MRVDNWESKLNAVIHDTIHNKGDYVLGKNDCGLFVVSCIESIIGKKVFDGKYKTFNQLKKNNDILKKSYGRISTHETRLVGLLKTRDKQSVSFLSIVKTAAVATKAAKATPEAAKTAAKTAAVTRLNNDKLAIHNG